MYSTLLSWLVIFIFLDVFSPPYINFRITLQYHYAPSRPSRSSRIIWIMRMLRVAMGHRGSVSREFLRRDYCCRISLSSLGNICPTTWLKYSYGIFAFARNFWHLNNEIRRSSMDFYEIYPIFVIVRVEKFFSHLVYRNIWIDN